MSRLSVKRGADGTESAAAESEEAAPSLVAVAVHRHLLNDEPAEGIIALGNDGSVVQHSQTYWAITATESTQNGVAVTMPKGLRAPISLMNDRAAAVWDDHTSCGVALLTVTGQTRFPISPTPLHIYQLWESDVLILLFETHVTALQPDGTEMQLAASAPPVSVAHDTTYQRIDVVTADEMRFRYEEPHGWYQVHLPIPKLPAVLTLFNAKTGGSAWLTEHGDLYFYLMAPDPEVAIPVGHAAAVTGNANHVFALQNSDDYRPVAPEVGCIDTRSLQHVGTLFPDQLLAMGRLGPSEFIAAHYPYVAWKGGLFKLA